MVAGSEAIVAIDRAAFGCGFDDVCLKPLKSCLADVIPLFDAIVA